MKNLIIFSLLALMLSNVTFASETYPRTFSPDRCAEVQNLLQITKFALVGEYDGLACKNDTDCKIVNDGLSWCGGQHAVNLETAAKYTILAHNPNYRIWSRERYEVCNYPMCVMAPFNYVATCDTVTKKCKTVMEDM